MLPFRTFLRLDVRAKLGGKKKKKIKLTKLVLLFPALSQALLCSVLATSLFSIFLNNSNDGIGSMLLKHTANTKPDRAAKGVERITMQSGEKNCRGAGEKRIQLNMEKCKI